MQKIKNKTLPSIRLSEDTTNNIHSALSQYNKGTIVKLSLQEFRRLSYELLSQIILQNKLKEIPVKFE